LVFVYFSYQIYLEDDDYADRGDLDKAIVLGIQAFSSITGIGSSSEFFFPAGCTLPQLVQDYLSVHPHALIPCTIIMSHTGIVEWPKLL